MQFAKAIDFIFEKLEKELPAHFTYHSLNHTVDVYTAAERIADAEGIMGVNKTLLLTATAYHDSGFLVKMKGHKKHSCEISEQYLPDFGYNEEELSSIKKMIMATQLPQKPHNLCEQIICDADLDYLGRDDFFTTGELLYKEFLWHGIVHNENEWNQVQLKFLREHHYFTKTSISQRAEKKAENVKLLLLDNMNAETNEKI